MDLTEILVNVEEGTKLYSPLFKEDLTFLHVDYSNSLPIRCITKEGFIVGFSKEGYYANIPVSLTCVLFPTPRMTWDNIIYVEEGDLLVYIGEDRIVQYFIAKETRFYNTNNTIPCHCGISNNGSIFDSCDCYISTKGTLDDFKEFKKVLAKYNCYLEGYSINRKEFKKFDFSSLKPFDQVLVRDFEEDIWIASLFSHSEKGGERTIENTYWIYCIPYNDDTKHLVGTTNPAPEFYRE